MTKKDGTGLSPLFVDLDGTLIKTDLFYESLLVLLKRNPLYLFMTPFWLLRGKAWLKRQIAERVTIDVSHLPYHHTFLVFLRSQSASGRKIILATASNERFANDIGMFLGIFTEVFASDARNNFSGRAKLDRILAWCNGQPFDYAGNANIDLLIWSKAQLSILVNPHSGVERKARNAGFKIELFKDKSRAPGSWLRALRAHQWLKNLLLFVPLVTSHSWSNTTAFYYAIGAFVAFCLCASGMYIFNDLMDLAADRVHPRKRQRPFASGTLHIVHGLLLIPILIGSGVLIATSISDAFVQVVFIYIALTLAYSLWLKSIVLVDVLVLASLYTLRVGAGAVAINVELSFWLLVFSMFIFLSLALAKRCSELNTLAERGHESIRGRDYLLSDLGYLHAMGVAAGFLSVLVLALFINSPEVAERYSRPEVMWLLCPVMLYWVGWIWLKVGRNEMHDDPLVFAVSDPASQIVVLAAAILVFLAV